MKTAYVQEMLERKRRLEQGSDGEEVVIEKKVPQAAAQVGAKKAVYPLKKTYVEQSTPQRERKLVQDDETSNRMAQSHRSGATSARSNNTTGTKNSRLN